MTGSTSPVLVLLRERSSAILTVLVTLGVVVVTLGIFFAFSGAAKAYAAETCGSGLSVHVAGSIPAACHAPTGPVAAGTTEQVAGEAESSIGRGDDHHRGGHHDRGHHHHTTETDDSSPAIEGTVGGGCPQSAPVAIALSAPASTQEGTARPD